MAVSVSHLFLESDVRRLHKQQQPQTSGMLSSVSILQHGSDAEKNVKRLLKMKSQHPEKTPQCFWRSLFKQNSSSRPFPLTQNLTSYKRHSCISTFLDSFWQVEEK